MLSAKSGHKVTPFLAQQQIKADKMNNYAHKKTEIPSVDNNLFFFFLTFAPEIQPTGFSLFKLKGSIRSKVI
jgi:hypothetical protein